METIAPPIELELLTDGDKLMDFKAKFAASGVLTLNVGGRSFTTRLDTLTQIKDTYFDSLLNGNWHPHVDKNGHIFIDRDANLFSHILSYLRGYRGLPDDAALLEQLRHEADFLGISALVSLIDAHTDRVHFYILFGRNYGLPFETSMFVLRKFPGSYFYRAFNRNFAQLPRTDDGKLIIYRESAEKARAFIDVLEYLKFGEVGVDSRAFKSADWKRLWEEAKYLELHELVIAFHEKMK